jgi:hypothetical protein
VVFCSVCSGFQACLLRPKSPAKVLGSSLPHSQFCCRLCQKTYWCVRGEGGRKQEDPLITSSVNLKLSFPSPNPFLIRLFLYAHNFCVAKHILLVNNRVLLRLFIDCVVYEEYCALLGCYAASNGKFSPTFRDNILKMRLVGCPETSVKNYHYSLHNNPEERSSHLLRGGNLKPRILHYKFSSKWDEIFSLIGIEFGGRRSWLI